jgi:hypothetical protein
MSLAAATVEYSLVDKEGREDGYSSLFNPTSPMEGGSVKSKKRGNQNKAKLSRGNYVIKLGKSEINLLGTPLTIAIWLVKYALVIFLGAVFFRAYQDERDEQKKVGVDMTWIDAFYYATVIATTVG